MEHTSFQTRRNHAFGKTHMNSSQRARRRISTKRSVPKKDEVFFREEEPPPSNRAFRKKSVKTGVRRRGRDVYFALRARAALRETERRAGRSPFAPQMRYFACGSCRLRNWTLKKRGTHVAFCQRLLTVGKMQCSTLKGQPKNKEPPPLPLPRAERAGEGENMQKIEIYLYL